MPAPVLVPNPHSMLLEIATQYGLHILLGFLYCVWVVSRTGWRAHTAAGNADYLSKRIGAIVVSSIPAFLIALNINSTYMSLQFIWLFWGSIAATALTISSRVGRGPRLIPSNNR
jgi:hypothetical protein